MRAAILVLLSLAACYRSDGYAIRPTPKLVAVGPMHACAISDGAVRCWGFNDAGQLGVSDIRYTLTPVVPAGMGEDAVSVVGSRYRNCAVIGEGLVCTSNGSAPMISKDVSAVAWVDDHGCVLVGDSVQCWGDNQNFGLGVGLGEDESLELPSTPVKKLPKGSLTGLGVSDDSSCVIIDNRVQCWGGPYLGDGSTEASGTPVEAKIDGEVSGLVGGYYDFCAIVGEGESVACWGSNQHAVGPDGIDASLPWTIPLEGEGRVTDVALGIHHGCAVVDGGVQCWGENQYGQVGTPVLGQVEPPGWVEGLGAGSDVVSIAAHDNDTCAMRADGAVLCWGLGGFGALGSGFSSEVIFGVTPVAGLETGVTAVAVNAYVGDAYDGATCAIKDGAVHCFGANKESERGDTNIAPLHEPQLTAIAAGATVIEAASQHFCALIDGGLKCWGNGYAGALGNGDQNNSSTPQQVSGLLSGVTGFAMGLDHGCAITGGELRCWGQNDNLQLGLGVAPNQLVPQPVPGLTAGVTHVGAGDFMTCAVLSGGADDELYCWGENENQQCGSGGAQPLQATPNLITGFAGTSPLRIDDVSCGSAHCCALVNGTVQCWGDDGLYELGNNSVDDSATPVLVQGLTAPTAIDAAAFVTCAVDQGAVLCWGDGNDGELGFGLDVTRLPTAEPVPDLPVGTEVSLSVGAKHVCAAVDGTLYCWGANYTCQLGLPCLSATPVEIEGL